MTSLDDDLAAWAATVRLPEADADAIFRRITSTPVPGRPARPARLVTRQVDAAWWRHFNSDFTARMVSSTRPVRQAA